VVGVTQINLEVDTIMTSLFEPGFASMLDCASRANQLSPATDGRVASVRYWMYNWLHNWRKTVYLSNTDGSVLTAPTSLHLFRQIRGG
jgi:hypothetical protein